MYGSRLLQCSLMTLAIGLITACDRPAPTATLNLVQSHQTLAAAGLELGESIEHDGLQIVPVLSLEPRQDDHYITLDEGLKAGTIEILETGVASANASDDASIESSGNQVNQVIVVNRCDKPLYLMPGEIILGGDQDRSIAEEYLIAAGGKPTPVQVFCVEHGRWGNRASSANAQLLAQVADNINAESMHDEPLINTLSKKADKDQFVASPTVANKSVRIAVQQSADQSRVWEEVAKVNAKSGAQSQSGSLTYNYTQKATTQRLEPYRRALREPIAEIPNIVGVVVVIDGKPESVDVFGSTPLFKKLWPKLLEGYALDAATHDESSNNPDYTQNDAVRFIAQVLEQSSGDEVRRGTTSQHGNVVAAAASADLEASFVEADAYALPLHVAGFHSDSQTSTLSDGDDSGYQQSGEFQQQISDVFVAD